MKRMISLLLVFSMIIPMSGCSFHFDEEAFVDYVEEEVSEAVDNTVAKVKEEVSNKADEVVEDIKSDASQTVEEIKDKSDEKKESISNWFDNALDDIRGYNMTITFVSNGGANGPVKQRFKENTYPKITDEKPVRAGYHFIGWTRLEGSNEPEYFAGEKTKFAFTQDTTLYACWEAYGYKVDDNGNIDENKKPLEVYANMGETHSIFGGVNYITIEHNYRIVKENGGKIIRIQCDCGFELTDRDISEDDFVFIKSDGKTKTFASLKKSKKEEYHKDYILYQTQDFAPVAMALIGSFYEAVESDMQTFDGQNIESINISNEKKFDALLSNFSEFGETLEKAAEFDLELANAEYSPEYVELEWACYDHYDDFTINYLLREMVPEDTNALARESKTMFFTNAEKFGKVTEKTSELAKVIYYGYDVFASDEMISSKTISMVKAIHVLVDFCPYVGDYYDQLFSTLEEGLVLYDKCCKQKNSYYEFLGEIFADAKKGEPIKGTRLTMQHIDQARNGIFDSAPSVMELLSSLLSCSDDEELNCYSQLSKTKKTLVVWYLTMRLEYDFENEYGITLEDYMEYLK